MDSCLSKVSPAKADIVREHDTEDGGTMRVVHHRADPTISSGGHVALFVVFYAFFGLYLGVTIYQFITAEPASTIGMQPSPKYGEIYLDITMRCVTGTCGTASIVSNYTNHPTSACYNPNGNRGAGLDIFTVPYNQSQRVRLCYTADDAFTLLNPGYLGTSMIQASFSDVQGFGVVDVASTDGRISRGLAMEATHVRSYHIGLTVELVDGAEVLRKPISLQYQMEGFRRDNQSDALIVMAPLAHVKSSKSKTHVLVLLADFGSAFKSLQLLFVALVPVWALLFGKTPKKRRALNSEGLKALEDGKGTPEMTIQAQKA